MNLTITVTKIFDHMHYSKIRSNKVLYGERKPRPGYSFYNDQFWTARQIKFVTDGYRYGKFYRVIFDSDPYPYKCFYEK